MKRKGVFQMLILLLVLSLGLAGCGKSNKNEISEDEAREIAVGEFNLKLEDVEFTQVDKDKDGEVLKYELEFIQGTTKYEVDINRETGEVLKAEKENL